MNNNTKKKKKLNYKKLKKERLLYEKKIITELNDKLISKLERSRANQRSAAKSGITDTNSKNEDLNDFNDENNNLNETQNDEKELLSFMRTSTYEKTLEFIKFLVTLITPKKKSLNNKKKKGERRSGQSSNDFLTSLSSLNCDNGINSMTTCIKKNFATLLFIFKENFNIPL